MKEKRIMEYEGVIPDYYAEIELTSKN